MGVEGAGSDVDKGVITVGDHDRIVAVCERCDSAYAAKVLSDGRIRPIGVDSCACGSDEFRPLG